MRGSHATATWQRARVTATLRRRRSARNPTRPAGLERTRESTLGFGEGAGAGAGAGEGEGEGEGEGLTLTLTLPIDRAKTVLMTAGSPTTEMKSPTAEVKSPTATPLWRERF